MGATEQQRALRALPFSPGLEPGIEPVSWLDKVRVREVGDEDPLLDQTHGGLARGAAVQNPRKKDRPTLKCEGGGEGFVLFSLAKKKQANLQNFWGPLLKAIGFEQLS